ncbi:DUF6253 family protein [Streptomyces sp. NPDC057411]|uniref:DUF6253 family protein n=1 Tax=unclassified Streptomyces TaxID=2593676 RepID=UPI00363C1069
MLSADGYVAVFTTPEGDVYRTPLVCWREDGPNVYGVTLHKGGLRRAEELPGFTRYAVAPGCACAPGVPEPAAGVGGRQLATR